MKYLLVAILFMPLSLAHAASSMVFHGSIPNNGTREAIIEIQGEQDIYSVGSLVSNTGFVESVTQACVNIRTNEGRLLRLDISGSLSEVTEVEAFARIEVASIAQLLKQHLDSDQILHLDNSTSSLSLSSSGLENGDQLLASSHLAAAQILTIKRGDSEEEIIVSAV